MLSLKYGLESLGHQARLSGKQLHSDEFNLVISAYLLGDDIGGIAKFPHAHINFELLSDGKINGHTDSGFYEDAMKKGAFVWDTIGTHGHLLTFGHCLELEEITHQEKEFDGYFFGLLSERRRAVIKSITENGMTVVTDSYCPHFIRNDKLSRSRVVLSIHQKPEWKHLGGLRPVFVAHQGMPTLAETAECGHYGDLCVMADDLAQALPLVAERWQEHGEKARETIRSRPMRRILERLLDECHAALKIADKPTTEPGLQPINKGTFGSKLNNDQDVMLEQVRENLKRDLPWFAGRKAHNRTALIVGGGPSLADTVDLLRTKHHQGGIIFALNGTHDWLIERGIVPEFHVMLDSRQENVKFVLKPHRRVHYLVSAFCHPDVFEALKGHRVTLWMSDMSGMLELVQDIDHKPVCLVGGGATVGNKTMFLAYLDGFRREHFFGFDSSYRGVDNHAYAQPMNDGESRITVTCNGRPFTCAPWMAKQAHEWKGQAKKLAGLGVDIWVHGDGLIPWMAQQMMKQAA